MLPSFHVGSLLANSTMPSTTMFPSDLRGKNTIKALSRDLSPTVHDILYAVGAQQAYDHIYATACLQSTPKHGAPP